MKRTYLAIALLLGFFAVGSTFAQDPFEPEASPFDSPQESRSSDPFGDDQEDDSPFGSDDSIKNKTPFPRPDFRSEQFRQLEEDFQKRVFEKGEEFDRLPPAERLEWLERELALRTDETKNVLALLSETGQELDQRLDRSWQMEADFHEERANMQDHISSLRDEIRRLELQTESDASKSFQINAHRAVIERMLVRSFESGNDLETQASLMMILEAVEDKDILGVSEIFGEPIQNSICRLTQSGNAETQRLASRLVSQMRPDDAIQFGVQNNANYWYCLETIDKNMVGADSLRRRMHRPVFLFEDKLPLNETLDQIGSIIGTSIILDSSVENVEDMSIEFELEDVACRNALTTILKPFELEYVVKDETISIYPKGHENLTVTLSYEIRGLLAPSKTVDDIVTLLNRAQEGDLVTIIGTGDSRIMVAGTEKQHQRISELLAKLPRNY